MAARHYVFAVHMLDGGYRPIADMVTEYLLAESKAFICPRCGHLWGRVCLNGQPGDPPWDAERRYCSLHSPYGGSFLWHDYCSEPVVESCIHDATPELIRYELSNLPPQEPHHA